MNSRKGVWLASVTLAISPVVWAGPDTSKTRQLADIQAEIQTVGSDVKKLALEKSAQIERLKKLEKQLGEQVNALNAIKADIQKQEQALQGIREKMTATQNDLKRQQKGLQGLVRSAYLMGNQEGLDVLLNQKDSALSGRMLMYYDYISKARLQKLQNITDDVQSLQKLEAQKSTENQLLQVALEKKQQDTLALQTLKQQRENLLAEINKDFASKQDQLSHLLHDEKKLESLLASLQKTHDNSEQSPPITPAVEAKPTVKESPPQQPEPARKPQNISIPVHAGPAFEQLKGQLPWPVQGGIVERFGSRRSETTWDGTVIAASEGAAIHAVANGRVVYADWLRGYGLMVIVDHGKGFMSLYAFNQSLQKTVGESVRTGDVLASVGRSGGRASAALYFGIRHKGRAVDPEKWCRKPGKG